MTDMSSRLEGALGRTLSAAAALAAAGLILAPAALHAHGDGVLELASASVAAGAEVVVRGSGFEAGVTYRLVLVGTLEEREIRDVRPDSAGDFSLSLSVPADLDEGRYRLTAVAPDGDVVDRAELAVVGRAAGEGGAARDGDAGRRAPNAGARAGEMPLDRDRSGVEWGVIGLLVGLSGGLGVGLLRR